ncbi:transposase family protein [Deinococcus sp. QL22]|uniref:transposase family protein n=1 Tax=Deinococcus sp. QL22 TaxID=2939437 RepID=UPI00353037A4
MSDLQAVLERLLPAELALQVVSTRLQEAFLEFTLASTRTSVPCPRCASLSASVHSHSQRQVQDVPWCTLPVPLHLLVRRWPLSFNPLHAAGIR